MINKVFLLQQSDKKRENPEIQRMKREKGLEKHFGHEIDEVK